MTTKKELYSLKEGGTVTHKWFGECYVDNVVVDVGIVLIPHTEEGVDAMVRHAGRKINSTLEADPNNILDSKAGVEVIVQQTGYTGTLF